MQISRRDMLKLGGLAAVGTAGLGLPLGRSASGSTPSTLASRNFPKVFATALPLQKVLSPTSTGIDSNGKPYASYNVYARQGTAAFVPGLATPVLGYYHYSGTGHGHRIDVERGTRIHMTVHNKLPATHPAFGTPLAISTHLHGSASLPQYDGFANDVSLPGQKKYYSWPNDQQARTMWFHDHGAHYTAENAYAGLAAQYHVHDPVERALLPQGQYDVALTLTDMMFKSNGSLMYDDRSHSGLWGDVILVNGAPWPVMKVKKRIYRFRLLNAGLSRSYRLRLSNGAPVHMVATDGGLMPKSQPVTSWRHAGAERYEFLIDFRTATTGQRIQLLNSSNPNNRDYDYTHKVMAFDVTDEPFDKSDPTWNTIPGLLDPGNEVMKLAPTSSMKVRDIRVERTNSEWSINGETWKSVVASNYAKVVANPELGATEIWNLTNNSGGWFHPVHIHLVDFKILSRNGMAPYAYERGPKDVAYVGEGETVKVIMKFGPHRGRYMIHCHNLPHEDHDMMHQFSVGLQGVTNDPNDPVKGDPPVVDND